MGQDLRLDVGLDLVFGIGQEVALEQRLGLNWGWDSRGRVESKAGAPAVVGVEHEADHSPSLILNSSDSPSPSLSLNQNPNPSPSSGPYPNPCSNPNSSPVTNPSSSPTPECNPWFKLNARRCTLFVSCMVTVLPVSWEF